VYNTVSDRILKAVFVVVDLWNFLEDGTQSLHHFQPLWSTK